jgi:hypothetical protein
LGSLLDIEAQTAALQNVPMLLPETVRHSIQELRRTVEQATAHVG